MADAFKQIKSQPFSLYQAPRRTAVLSLFDLSLKVIHNNLDLLGYVGGVPNCFMAMILKKASPEHLAYIEAENPDRDFETEELWKRHCKHDFRQDAIPATSTWKLAYEKWRVEREEKLEKLGARARAQTAHNEKGRSSTTLITPSQIPKSTKRKRSAQASGPPRSAQMQRLLSSIKGRGFKPVQPIRPVQALPQHKRAIAPQKRKTSIEPKGASLAALFEPARKKAKSANGTPRNSGLPSGAKPSSSASPPARAIPKKTAANSNAKPRSKVVSKGVSKSAVSAPVRAQPAAAPARHAKAGANTKKASSPCRKCIAARQAGYPLCAPHKAEAAACKKCVAARTAGYKLCAAHKVALAAGGAEVRAASPPKRAPSAPIPGFSKAPSAASHRPVSSKSRGAPTASTRGPVASSRGGPVASSRGPVASTRGPVASTRGPVASSRGSVASSRGGPVASRGVASTTKRGVSSGARTASGTGGSGRRNAMASGRAGSLASRGKVPSSRGVSSASGRGLASATASTRRPSRKSPDVERSPPPVKRPPPRYDANGRKIPRKGSRKEVDPFATSSDEELDPSTAVASIMGYNRNLYNDDDDDMTSMEVTSVSAHDRMESATLARGRAEDREEAKRKAALEAMARRRKKK